MNNNRLFAVFFSAVSALCVQAQNTQSLIKNNPEISAGNYCVYPGPKSAMTAVPDGYVPFYISHYGRHGSRYMLTSEDAKEAFTTLDQADIKGNLTEFGKSVRSDLHKVIVAMDEREGELTPLGHLQHQQIATRMFNNFGQVFKDSARVDVKSSIVVRCILSMNSFTNQLSRLNPKIQFSADASRHDMGYISKQEDNSHKLPDAVVKWNKLHSQFCDSLSHPDRLMKELFGKADYLDEKHAGKLARRIFNVACDLQDMPGIDFDLFSVFTTDEIFDYWQSQNAYWFGFIGGYPTLDRSSAEMAGDLLLNIINQAQEAIDGGGVAANLRFGHDTAFLRLLALMQINNVAYRTDNLNELTDKWRDFDFIPMAANLQIVFFKNSKNDVILKVLLNENEATLPIRSVGANCYSWKDFKNFYQQILNKK